MNNGAFGENFPYSNFHDLNMDWIIKITKDFLDQYTNIQNVIATGLEDLENTTENGLEALGDKTEEGVETLNTLYTNLNDLLQQWYDTHSADIAHQLESALNNLNAWYTLHENYLDQTLAANILAFNNAADAKAETTIASIPDDYTTITNTVIKLKSALEDETGNSIINYSEFSEKQVISLAVSVGSVVSLTPVTDVANAKYAIVDCAEGDIFTINGIGASGYRLWGFVDSSNILLSKAESGATANNLILTAPEDAEKLILNSFTDVQSYKGKIIQLQLDNIKTTIKDTMAVHEIEYSDIMLYQGISLSDSVGTVISIAPSHTTFPNKFSIVDCSEGDKFTINGESVSGYRLWGFVDSSNKLLSRAESGATGNNLILTAPEDASKLILNSSSDIQSYIGELLPLRLDNVDSNLKSIIKDTTNAQIIEYSDITLCKAILLSASIGATVDTTPVYVGYPAKYAVIPCLPGDYFTVNGTSVSGYRLWAFLDSSYKLITKATSGSTGNNTIIKAPENAAYLVLNSTTDINSYKGYVVDAMANNLLRNPKGFKKMLTIGDSLTNAAYNGANWQPYIVDSFGLTGYVKAGAIGRSVATVAEGSIYETVQSLTTDPDVNLITFWGGTNDFTFDVLLGDFNTQLDPLTRNTTTFYGALIGCVEKLISLYPAGRIIMIGTTPRVFNVDDGLNYHNENNSANLYLQDYVDAVQKVAEWFGLPFLNLLNAGGINELNISEYMYQQTKESGGVTTKYYLHFSDTGMPYIGNRIAAFIRSIG